MQETSFLKGQDAVRRYIREIHSDLSLHSTIPFPHAWACFGG
jgi:hypothetical protein